MKKFILLFILAAMICFSSKTFAQYPIPSYNVSVRSRADFQEKNPAKGRRVMNIKVQCVGGKNLGTCQATVWVYSLDGQTILGPYTVYGGEILSVPIDDREWGVYVESDDEITVDVWISTGEAGLLQGCVQNE